MKLGRQEAAFRAFHDGGVRGSLGKAWSSRMIRVRRRGPSARLRRRFISLRLGVCQWRAALVMAMGRWVAEAVCPRAKLVRLRVCVISLFYFGVDVLLLPPWLCQPRPSRVRTPSPSQADAGKPAGSTAPHTTLRKS